MVTLAGKHAIVPTISSGFCWTQQHSSLYDEHIRYEASFHEQALHLPMYHWATEKIFSESLPSLRTIFPSNTSGRHPERIECTGECIQLHRTHTSWVRTHLASHRLIRSFNQQASPWQPAVYGVAYTYTRNHGLASEKHSHTPDKTSCYWAFNMPWKTSRSFVPSSGLNCSLSIYKASRL